MDDGLGKGLWVKLIGGVLLLGVALFVLFILIDKLLLGLGFLGGMIVIVAILVFIAWRYDKHQQTSYRAD